MRLAGLVVVVLCVVGLGLAAPQIATDGPLGSSPFGEADSDGQPAYGPVEGSYFRASSFDRYTGSGWERTASPESTAALDGPPDESDRVTVEYEVEAPVRTLPAAWRPTDYRGPEAAVFDGSLEPTESLEPGAEFAVTSRRPVWTEAELRNAGTDYPDDLDRYTELPADTPDELGGIAAEVTGDAETPYEKSVAVNRWLHEEKNYSLSVDRPDGDVATAFATDMDAGYCTYFATTMVAMLRTEGVPARYVTGYSPYEQTGAGEHVIRGKHAHAWVEVYFTDVGWVPFDPTPATERQAARDVATADADRENGAREAALDGAFASVTQQDDQDEGWRQLNARFDVDGDVAPGNEIAVTVRDSETDVPIDDAQVRFNGRPVGWTGADGDVTAEVPYEGTLRITAYVYEGDGEPPPVVGDDAAGGTGPSPDSIQDLRFAGSETELSGSITALSEEVLFRATVEEGAVLRRGPAVDDTEHEESTPTTPEEAGLDGTFVTTSRSETLGSVGATPASERTFELNTTIDVALTPGEERDDAVVFDTGFEARPDEPLRVEATMDGRPVTDATVRAGEETATTDADGVAVVPTPYERPAEVRVERGAASGNETIPVRGRLSVGIEGERAAGGPLTVEATIEGTPVPDATVTNHVETATTGADGTAVIPAPYASGIDGMVVVRRGDFRWNDRLDVDIAGGTLRLDEAVPGRHVSLRALVGEHPIRAGSVSVDGEAVAETDDFGRATVRLPYNDTATVVVERGDVRAEETYNMPTDMTLETDGWVRPGGTIDVRATVADEPVANATVFVGGEAVATTGPDGTATVDVPPAAATLEVTVQRGAATGETAAGYPVFYWVVTLGLVVGAVVIRRRRDSIAGSPLSRRELVAAVGPVVAGLLRDFEALLATRDAGAESGEPAAVESPTEPPSFLVEPADDNDVYGAWAALAGGLDGEQRTPAAVADRAIEEGLPREPVAELTDLFRAVRYGEAEPTADRERRARRAFEAITEDR